MRRYELIDEQWAWIAPLLPPQRGHGRSGQEGGIEEPADHALGRSRGGWGTKIHVVTDGAGTPLTVHVTPGQAHESTAFEPTVDAVRIQQPTERSRCRPLRIAADKAYDIPRVRRWLREHHIGAVIPQKAKPHDRRVLIVKPAAVAT